MPDPPLLERDIELGELLSAFEEASAGRGQTIIVEGAAGSGKSALIAAAADQAEHAGIRVLRARGSELESEFAFGAVRQLFEQILAAAAPAERERLLAGAAAPAARVVAVTPDAPPTDAAAGFAALHAVYWLAANLAADTPLLLVLDDAHWGDASSLRALAFLAARVADVRIALVLAMRPDEPGAQAALLDELIAAPGTKRIALGPLGRESVARIVRERVPDADDSLCDACHTATAGNPLYLQELLRAMSTDHDDLDTTAVDAVGGLAVPSLGDRIVRRIGHLAAGAPAVAAAMALLGDGGELATAALLSGMSLREAGRVAHRLRRIEVLSTEDPFAFVHPLVRRSVYDSIPATEREASHKAAAELLRAAGAPAEAVAAHLSTLAPAGSSSVAATLVQAAEDSVSRAAPDEAIRWYRRALEEDAAEPSRASILAGLGAAELMVFDLGAVPHLQEALECAEDPGLHSRVALKLADTLFLAGEWSAVMALIADTSRDLVDRDPEALAELYAIGVMVATYSPSLELRVDPAELMELTRGSSWGAHALAGVLAGAAAHRGDGSDQVTTLVDRALEGGRLLSERDAGAWAAAAVLIALAEIDDFERAVAVSQQMSAAARRTGSGAGLLTAAAHRGWVYARQGQLDAAEAELVPGLAQAREMGSATVLASMVFYAQDLALERPRLSEVADLAETVQLGPLEHTFMDAVATIVRGRLRVSRGEREAGISDLRAGVEMVEAIGIGPTVGAARSILALALPPSERAEAMKLVAAELELAQASGLARPQGVALRAQGVLEGGEQGIALLQESVSLLADSGARLEHARSLVELGAALRRAGNRTEASIPLAEGMELADECGADRLLARAQDELRAAGGRPRRTAQSGVAALTASELRVARMAAAGATNRDIAQDLFVSLKTVETHLYNAYAKLGLAGQGSRERLRDVLGA